ncbi:MAG: type 4a pilus biogenesis protein PilO [Burkholderiales bacterium]|nr:type 4a pilus biogenesis protein PilO [Burkholderiales bacterium]
MNIADQFKNVNWKDIGNAPPGPKVLTLVLLLVAVVVAGWYFYWDGLNQELEAAQRDEAKLKEEYKVKKQKAVNLPELKKQLVQVGQYVSTLEKQLPSKAEMDALLTDINQAGLGRGLQFDLFRPATVSVKEYYAEQPIAVRVTGNYHDLGAFASDIANLSRIVTLNDITITIPQNSSVLAMDTVAKTFRYLDSEEVAAQRKARAPAGGAKK